MSSPRNQAAANRPSEQNDPHPTAGVIPRQSSDSTVAPYNGFTTTNQHLHPERSKRSYTAELTALTTPSSTDGQDTAMDSACQQQETETMVERMVRNVVEARGDVHYDIATSMVRQYAESRPGDEAAQEALHFDEKFTISIRELPAYRRLHTMVRHGPITWAEMQDAMRNL